MRSVALEEHFLFSNLVEQHFARSELNLSWLTAKLSEELNDVGAGRIAAMDEAGITVQVLSASMPGADLLDGRPGILLAQANNDRLAEAVRRYPDRFAGFAHLPMRSPDAAADELERCVRDLGFKGAMINGLTADRFLDHRSFEPVLSRCEALDVPIYLHPNLPPKSVADAYFSGLPGIAGPMLASGLFGWHSETAIHVFRLALAGTFERFPGLRIIVGHMGEMLPFALGRADHVMRGHRGFERAISDIILNHVYITTSGFFTIPPFLNALTTFGADRILFSVDYPYSRNASGRAMLDALPVSPADRAKIAHGNVDRLLKLTPA
jgi:predicted TIM-barrel fold metal-dependent hydrolase